MANVFDARHKQHHFEHAHWHINYFGRRSIIIRFENNVGNEMKKKSHSRHCVQPTYNKFILKCFVLNYLTDKT